MGKYPLMYSIDPNAKKVPVLFLLSMDVLIHTNNSLEILYIWCCGAICRKSKYDQFMCTFDLPEKKKKRNIIYKGFFEYNIQCQYFHYSQCNSIEKSPLLEKNVN